MKINKIIDDSVEFDLSSNDKNKALLARKLGKFMMIKHAPSNLSDLTLTDECL